MTSGTDIGLELADTIAAGVIHAMKLTLAALVLALLAAACSSTPSDSPWVYDTGWKHGLKSGHCGLLNEDNCHLYWSPPFDTNWSGKEMIANSKAYDDGFDAGQTRVFDCGNNYSVRVTTNAPFASPDHYRYTNSDSAWASYFRCRDAAFQNPYQ